MKYMRSGQTMAWACIVLLREIAFLCAKCYTDFEAAKKEVYDVMSKSQFLHPLLREEVNDMSDKEQTTMLIDIYINLQRIKLADDKEKEIDRQITAAKAKLEALGVVTETLDIR